MLIFNKIFHLNRKLFLILNHFFFCFFVFLGLRQSPSKLSPRKNNLNFFNETTTPIKNSSKIEKKELPLPLNDTKLKSKSLELPSNTEKIKKDHNKNETYPFTSSTPYTRTRTKSLDEKLETCKRRLFETSPKQQKYSLEEKSHKQKQIENENTKSKPKLCKRNAVTNKLQTENSEILQLQTSTDDYDQNIEECKRYIKFVSREVQTDEPLPKFEKS